MTEDINMMRKRTKKIVSSLIVASILTIGITILPAQNNTASAATQQQFQPLQGKIVYVPSGVTFPASTTMELSSETLNLGDGVFLVLSSDFYYNNTLIAPVGSSINGTVVKVKKAGRAGINGQLMIKFTNIVTPYGQMIPISGRIQTDDNTGVIRCGTKAESAKEYAKDIAVGSASGAIIGTIMGPLSGGKVGKGAVYGTAVGAGAGLAKSLLDKGTPATVPAGAVINIQLDQQISFSPQQNYQY